MHAQNISDEHEDGSLTHRLPDAIPHVEATVCHDYRLDVSLRSQLPDEERLQVALDKLELKPADQRAAGVLST